jgi:hypothetical protein
LDSPIPPRGQETVQQYISFSALCDRPFNTQGVIEIVTRKEKVGTGKKEKKQRLNDTAHNRAVTNPEVRDALNAFQSGWKKLSPRQSGEQLKRLLELGCSIRGIAKESGLSESTLRRYVQLVDSSKPKSESKAEMERAFAKEPKERLVASALRAQPTKRIPGPILIVAKEPSMVDDGLGGKESRTEEDEPKLSPLELYKLRHPSRSEMIRLLASMPELTKPRPFRDARSMKRQAGHCLLKIEPNPSLKLKRAF